MKRKISFLLTAAMLTTAFTPNVYASSDVLFEDGSTSDNTAEFFVSEETGQTDAASSGAVSDGSGDLFTDTAGSVSVETKDTFAGDAYASDSDASGNDASEEGIEINEANFPDAVFREYVSRYDKNDNGILGETEIEVVDRISLSSSGISNLQGIEFFTNLEYLNIFYNSLASLDVSNNTALTELNCSYNSLTSLNISNNTALVTLNCDSNLLTSLDVSNNTALTTLYCDGNKLTSLNVSNNTALKILGCEENAITSLDISNNTALEELYCSSNNLTSLDVSHNTALTTLYCGRGFGKSYSLEMPDHLGNYLTSLDVSQNTALVSLACEYNSLTSLDVSSNTALKQLYCSYNSLSGLDISHNTALTTLYCYNDGLTSLDVSNNTALTTLYCQNNSLTNLDVSSNTALKQLYCQNNSLTSLDISHNPELTYLDCTDNQITTLDIRANTKLKNYSCDSETEVVTATLETPVLAGITSTASGVKVTWNASDGATNYRVFRKTSGGSWKKIGDTASTSYTDTTAKSGTTYIYTVRCVTTDGSLYTSSYDKTGLSITYIAAPVLSDVKNTSAGVKITWTASTGAEKYRVYRKTPGGSWKRIANTSSTSYTDKTAVSGTTYVYTVRCINSSGSATTSGYDETGLTITYIAAPALSAVSNAAGGVKITWEASTGAAQYRVFRKTSGGSWKKIGDTTSTSYTDTSAKSGTTYTYTVRCLNSAGTSYTSGFDSTGLGIKYLSCGTISKLTNTSTGIKVTWNKVTGASGYYVYRKTSSGTYKKIKTVTGESTVTYTDTAVKDKNGTTYLYAVKAYSGNTASAYKSQTTVRLTTPTLSGVMNSAAGSVTVQWAAVENVTGYQIMYSTSSDFGTYSTAKVSDASSVSKVISGLTKGKTYYVRIRTYKKVSGTTYSSGWTSKKSIKISK